MSHKGIRTLIEKTALKLQDDVQFSYGVDTDFNQARKKGNLLINVSPLTASPQYAVNGVQNYMKSWNVEMVFFKIDNTSKLDYPTILDDVDTFVDTFINQLNFFLHKSDQFILSGFNQSPFVKATADCLTGWLLTFTIFANDDFDYCVEC